MGTTFPTIIDWKGQCERYNAEKPLHGVCCIFLLFVDDFRSSSIRLDKQWEIGKLCRLTFHEFLPV